MKDAVLAAFHRIRPYVRETPVDESSLDGGQSVFLKLEHLQHTGSFKFRGASNKIALLTPDQAKAGVVAASNGNHGMGVAAAAAARGIAAEVYVSTHVSPAKARRIEALGARLHTVGDDPLTAELAARHAAEASGRTFISPYNDLDVAAGQGTIAVELERQIPGLDAIFVAVGGGGLIGGIGGYCKGAAPSIEIVGCWPENSPVMLECMRAGRVIDVPEQPTLSESTAGGLEPGCGDSRSLPPRDRPRSSGAGIRHRGSHAADAREGALGTRRRGRPGGSRVPARGRPLSREKGGDSALRQKHLDRSDAPSGRAGSLIILTNAA